MSLPFDLKYRPRKFNHVLGNHGVKKLLLNRSRNSDLHSRSMMFGGVKGCGKTTFSRIVARAIACHSPNDGEPCLECSGCISVDSDTSVSYDEFDAATQGTVDKIREILSDIEYGTIDGKPRVVTLDEAHRLTKQAQDALLRPMEDRRIVIILCTTEPHNIRSAIRDRVEEYPISPPKPEDLFNHIKAVCELEGVQYEENAIWNLIDINRSNPRTCLTGLHSLHLLGGVNIDTIKSIYRLDSQDKISHILANLDFNLRSCFDNLESLFQYEGPMWVRDEIINLISQSIRAANGSKNSKLRSFYQIRGIRWADLARDLALLDRPDAADIECVLLSSVKVARTTELASSTPINTHPILTELSVPPTKYEDNSPKVKSEPKHQVEKKSDSSSSTKSDPKLDLKKEPLASKTTPSEKKEKFTSIEVDGVLFTQNEELTSLDGKIEKGSHRVRSSEEETPERLKSDSRMIPISEKEFAREFIKGFK